MADREYIERDAVLEIVKRTNGDYAAAFAEISRLPTASETEVMACAEANLKYANDSLEILRQIREKVSFPAADVAPVVHAEWRTTNAYPHWLWCSECHKKFIPNMEWIGRYDIPTNYCPNCGAKMKGE